MIKRRRIEEEESVTKSDEDLSPQEISKQLGFKDSFILQPHQIDALKWATKRLKNDPTMGFILADEMGLGKTVVVLSLLRYLSKGAYTNPTLIVVPVSVIDHWRKEALRCWDEKDVFIYHLPTRKADFEREMLTRKRLWNEKATKTSFAKMVNAIFTINKMWEGKFPDNVMSRIFTFIQSTQSHWKPKEPLYLGPKIIITTAGIVREETGEKILFSFIPHFNCVVLDEAHIIRNASLVEGPENEPKKKKGSRISEELFELAVRAKVKIAITGTPLVNKDEDLISIAKFIGHGPGANPRHFFFLESRKERLIQWAEQYVLRRLKRNLISTLPNKFIHTFKLHISQDEVNENKEWASKLADLMALLKSSKDSDPAISKKILGVLTRMRQLCISSLLYKKPGTTAWTTPNTTGTTGTEDVDINKWLANPEDLIVPTPNTTSTHHVTQLYENYSASTPPNYASTPNYVIKNFRQQIKLQCAVEDILRLTNGGPVHKQALPPQSPYNGARVVIVSSQFVRALELMAVLLRSDHIFSFFKNIARQKPNVLIYHGGMSTSQRNETLNIARTSKTPTVLLLSFLSGNVGLDLVFDEKNETLANDPVVLREGKSQHLYQLDPWWNKAMSTQLFDRIHRLTQTRAVHIHQLINMGTIEQYMLELQHSKHTKAMDLIGLNSEKVFAKMQYDLYKNKNGKKFTLKGAVDRLIEFREEYSKQSGLSHIQHKMTTGFRDPKVDTIDPDNEVEKIRLLNEEEDEFGLRPMSISPPSSPSSNIPLDTYKGPYKGVHQSGDFFVVAPQPVRNEINYSSIISNLTNRVKTFLFN